MRGQAIATGYSKKEDIVHRITHGIGVLLGIAGLATLVVYSSRYGDTRHIISSGIYGISTIMLYTASTLYHSMTKSVSGSTSLLSLCASNTGHGADRDPGRIDFPITHSLASGDPSGG